MSIDIPILEGEEWWDSQVIDDTDSLIRILLDLTNSCIKLKIRTEESKQLYIQLSLYTEKNNIELETDKWLFFCQNLSDTIISELAIKVELQLNSYVRKYLPSRLK